MRIRLALPGCATVALIATGTVWLSGAGAQADAGDPPITGEIFRDHDASGTRDALEPGFTDVVVTAYDAAGGSSVGTVAADGTYSIDVTALAGGTAGYRVEFAGLPDHMESGPHGPDSGTSVQFVAAGGTADYGVFNPAQYCGPSPELVTTCFQGGALGLDGPAIVDFVYEAGTTSTTSNDEVALTPHPPRTTTDVVGPVRGLAYHRQTDVIFAAAYAKRHSPYPGATPGSPDDDAPDTIWTVGRDGSTPTPFVTIEAGDDHHDYADLIGDAAFWDDVGRTAWGDIDLSEREDVLYAANLFDGLIYAIPVTVTAGAPVAGTPSTIDLGALTTIDCSNGGWVPGAIKAHDGLVYLSATCIADGAGATAADLAGYVYAYDPAGGTATEVAAFPLNYTRGYASQDFSGTPTASADYQPWVASEPPRQGALGQIAPPGAALGPFGQSYYPQPWLSDIEFDEANNLLVGITDRFGDQFGNDNAGAASGNGEGVAAGDTVRLLPTGSGTWSLTGGDDDFYDGDRYPFDNLLGGHEEISLGHLAVLLGRGEVVANAFDPAPVTGPVPAPGGGAYSAAYRAGGLIYMAHDDGSRSRSYQVFGLDAPGTFGKASGIGDIELICEAAPIEIGNFLWIDADGDGIQDPDEAPVVGATVSLYDDDGVLVASVLTDDTGQYYFSDGVEPNADYTIRIDHADDYSTGPLVGLDVTLADQGSDLADSDATTVDGFPQISITTGGPGANDHTLDIGFTPALYRIGSLVWEDHDDDGTADPGERPIADVVVDLLDGDDDLIDTTTTDEFGEYGFDGLVAGTYRVRIPGDQPQLDGLRTSGTPVTEADGDVDNDNNGVPDDDRWISGPVQLGDADGIAEPTGEANGITGASNEDGAYHDGRSNQTVDFGFHRGLRLGNQVWLDTGAGADADNGLFDAGETGLADIAVELWRDDGDGVFEPTTDDVFVAADTTDGEGNYLFDGLVPGTYIVAIDDTGLDLVPSSPTPAADPEAVDNDNDGRAGDASGYVAVSNQVTLSVGGEPTGETDTEPDAEDAEAEANETTPFHPDVNSNLRVDFGFVGEPPLELGNQLWFDDDNDGEFDPGEPVVPAGVVVELLDAADDVLASTSTDGAGRYLFTGLAPGDYVVQIPASEFAVGRPLAGFGPSTGPASSTDPDDDVESNNDGVPGPANTVRSGVVTLDHRTEPTDEVDAHSPATPNESSNLTVDFGFVQTGVALLELGNLVFFDTDNDGWFEPVDGELPIADVTVMLYDTSGNLIAMVDTGADGEYRFTGLAPGDYVVGLPPSNFAPGGALAGTFASSGPAISGDPNDDVDNNSDGVPLPDGSMRSGVVRLSAGDEPNDETEDPTQGYRNTDSNLTVDFGVYSLSLGDVVWFDANNDGVRQPDEDVLPDVAVELYDENGDLVATATTDDDGVYLFTGLPEGVYVVVIAAENFNGGALEGLVSSTGNDDDDGAAPDPDDDVDDDDNGTPAADGTVRSSPIELTASDEPGAHGNDNPTVDFGFFRVESEPPDQSTPTVPPPDDPPPDEPTPEDPPPEIPLTGSGGAMLMPGIMLMLGGLALTLVARRRRPECTI